MPFRYSVSLYYLMFVMLTLGADDEEKSACEAGENVKMKLSGVEEEEVQPGFVLCASDSLCTTSQMFDAQVKLLKFI